MAFSQSPNEHPSFQAVSQHLRSKLCAKHWMFGDEMQNLIFQIAGTAAREGVLQKHVRDAGEQQGKGTGPSPRNQEGHLEEVMAES